MLFGQKAFFKRCSHIYTIKGSHAFRSFLQAQGVAVKCEHITSCAKCRCTTCKVSPHHMQSVDTPHAKHRHIICTVSTHHMHNVDTSCAKNYKNVGACK